MFKYDSEGALESVCIVDLQLMRWTRASLDLAYFLYTSVDPHFRQKRIEGLLQYYHSHLRLNLVALGQDENVFPWDVFRREFEETIPFGFVLGCFITQLIMNNDMTGNDGAFDIDKDWSKEFGGSMENMTEEQKKVMAEKWAEMMKEAAVKAAKSNKALTDRIVALVDEAIEKNII